MQGEKERHRAKDTLALLSLLEKKEKKDNSLLSFTYITEFTPGLGQISEALVHNKRR